MCMCARSAAYSRFALLPMKWQVIPTVPRFAVSRTDVVCLFVCRDTLKGTTADISCLIDIKREFFDGKDV